jgi:hypothetical protein
MCLDAPLNREPFGAAGRKIVREKLDISFGGLSNYIKSLYTKDFLYKDELDKYVIRPFLIPNANEQLYQFKLERDNEFDT